MFTLWLQRSWRHNLFKSYNLHTCPIYNGTTYILGVKFKKISSFPTLSMLRESASNFNRESKLFTQDRVLWTLWMKEIPPVVPFIITGLSLICWTYVDTRSGGIRPITFMNPPRSEDRWSHSPLIYNTWRYSHSLLLLLLLCTLHIQPSHLSFSGLRAI